MTRRLALLLGAVVLAGSGVTLAGAGPAAASIADGADSAVSIASASGYRTGVAVLDLTTGAYTGAGQDTASFASESVAKVLIATELLATGQMTGSTEATAYQMITESDDDDADALYGLAGGDDVINLVAARYGISFLGSAPAKSGWWGNTEINAKGMVYLYAAIAKDPTVGPWLMNAMAHTSEYGADGTYQFFGLPSATTGAAVKQGWGDDGDDSPNAVFDSTGYVDGDKYAVAILTDGPSSTYGSAISAMVTDEAQALMPGGQLDDPAAHNPVVADLAATATGSTVRVTGAASDPDSSAAVQVKVFDGDDEVAAATASASGAFTAAFEADDGSHTYTVVVDNVGEGTANASASTPAVSVAGDPSGRVSAVVGGAGEVTITGDETDPNATAARPTVSVGGVIEHETVRSTSYSIVVPAKAGAAEVEVTYNHSADGQDVVMGNWPVVVAETAAQRHDRAERRDLEQAAIALGVILVGIALATGIARRRARPRTRVGV